MKQLPIMDITMQVVLVWESHYAVCVYPVALVGKLDLKQTEVVASSQPY